MASHSGLEPRPDPQQVASLAGEILEILIPHIKVWGNGNKPRFEAISALGYAFATICEHHPDDERQIMAGWFEASTAGCLDALKKLRGKS